MGFSDVQCRPYKMAKLDAHLSLQEAARVCDVPSLRRILQEEDVDVNGKDKEGYTALYYVIYRGDCSTQASDAMRVLCEHGADVNEQLEALDPLKPTYLFTAMCGYFQGNYMLDVMKTLLQSGADPNVRNAKGRTALFMACYYKRIDVVELLLAFGADVNELDARGASPLHAAVQWCNPFDRRYAGLSRECCTTDSVVSRLLDHGAVVNHRDFAGNLPLHVAISNSKRRYVDRECDDIQVLLRHGSEIYLPSGFDGLDTLQLAAKNGKYTAVRYCLESGMCPNKFKCPKVAPLNLATMGNHPEAVRTLLRYGAQINVAKNGISALHIAAFEGLPDMVNLLLDHGADPCVSQPLQWMKEESRFPLLTAGHINAVKILVSKGAALCLNNSCSADSSEDSGILTLQFLLRSECGHSEYRSRLCTLFYNPYLQHAFCSDIFQHLVRENVIRPREAQSEISFHLDKQRFIQLLRTACPKKLLALRLAGLRLTLFNCLLRHGRLLLDKMDDRWQELYSCLQQPLSLKENSRIAIRRCVPAPLSASVTALPLPRCIQDYLLMSDLT